MRKFEVMLGMPTFEYRTMIVEAESREHAQKMVELDTSLTHSNQTVKDLNTVYG